MQETKNEARLYSFQIIKWTSMGNIGSQISNHSNKYKLESIGDVQRLSLPRIGQNQHSQQKIALPIGKDAIKPKLRSTENGKILHSGGTLSGRQPENRVSRGNFMNAKEKVNLLKELNQENDKIFGYHPPIRNSIKKSGSEPDLRVRLRQERNPVGNNGGVPKRYEDYLMKKRENQDNNRNTRRIGLFKTRIESNNRRNKINIKVEEKREVKHQSLLDLRQDIPVITTYDELERDELEEDLDLSRNDDNHVKKYYFGMENNTTSNPLIEELNYTIHDDILPDFPINHTEDTADPSQNIILNLRPILPKKQLEIPRFSSSLAWKLLYSIDSDSNLDRSSLNNTEDDQFLAEERIAPLSPSRLSKSLDFQFSQDKSGDSGISGDETPKPLMTWSQYYKSKQSWTPQQDLGDEDSATDNEDINEERKFNSVPYYANSGNDTGNKPHIFSLSLPRDHFSNQCTTTLEKYKHDIIKRTSSGHLNNSNNDLEMSPNHYSIKNSNWLLSKSAPNSLNNGFASLDSGNCMHNGPTSSLVAVQPHAQSKGRIMYLPQGSGICWANNQKSTKHKTEMPTGMNEDLLQEVERREQDRLREIEAMQRIEEEFRKKRAR